MAGMLPGVEAARRRRVHVSSANGGGTTTSRRPSLCLYATNNHEFNLNSHASVERSAVSCDDDMTLDAAARESKRRLDLRFQNIRKSKGNENGSANSKTNLYGLIWKSAYQSC